MVYLPLGFSLFLVSWKNLTNDENSRNLAGLWPLLSELWQFRFFTLVACKIKVAVCPIFEPQYTFATKVMQTSVTWGAKQCPTTLNLRFSKFGLLLLQCATPK